MPSLSPDGRRLAFIAVNAEGRRSLWVRALDADLPQEIAGTEDARNPFWSPDGKSIAFFTSQKLRKVEAAGGPAADLCDAVSGSAGSWSAGGDILFAASPGRIYRVAAAGGNPVPVTRNPAQLEAHSSPDFLPDSRRFLYSVAGPISGVFAASLDSDDVKPVLKGVFGGRYQDGYLVYRKDATLLAQPFDLARSEVQGEAVVLAQQVAPSPGFSNAAALSSAGIAYQHDPGGFTQIAWVDRNGKPLGLLGDPEPSISDLELSPDGGKVAAAISSTGGQRTIWIYDVARQLKTRLALRQERQAFPVWSPDGKQIAYLSNPQPGSFELRTQSLGNPADNQLLLSTDKPSAPQSWSSDGRFLTYSNGKIMILSLAAGSQPAPFVGMTPSTQITPRFSPDGKWIAYASDESGRNEIYIASFPGGSNQVQISAKGGRQARWRRDGKEIFFVAPDGKLMAAPVISKGSLLEAASATALFEIHDTAADSIATYDAAPDGERFVVVDRQFPTSITLLMNWKNLLKNK
jgi:dipeptidyl aminopeptidase/acylaminoacyl peptidase